MKTLTQHFTVFAIVFFLLPNKGVSQKNISIDTINHHLIDVAKEIMINAGTCALITLDTNGRPRVRTMDPFPPKEDLVVWFGTNSNSRKVEQIKNNSRVTLYYLDHDSTGYVMIHGVAQLVNDDEKKKKYWKKEWEAFYPNKNDNYLLIKVSPDWMEIVSETRGIVGDEKTWEPQKIIFNTKH